MNIQELIELFHNRRKSGGHFIAVEVEPGVAARVIDSIEDKSRKERAEVIFNFKDGESASFHANMVCDHPPSLGDIGGTWYFQIKPAVNMKTIEILSGGSVDLEPPMGNGNRDPRLALTIIVE